MKFDLKKYLGDAQNTVNVQQIFDYRLNHVICYEHYSFIKYYKLFITVDILIAIIVKNSHK